MAGGSAPVGTIERAAMEQAWTAHCRGGPQVCQRVCGARGGEGGAAAPENLRSPERIEDI